MALFTTFFPLASGERCLLSGGGRRQEEQSDSARLCADSLMVQETKVFSEQPASLFSVSFLFPPSLVPLPHGPGLSPIRYLLAHPRATGLITGPGRDRWSESRDIDMARPPGSLRHCNCKPRSVTASQPCPWDAKDLLLVISKDELIGRTENRESF